MGNSTLSRPTGPSVCVVKGKGKGVGPPRAGKWFLTPSLCHIRKRRLANTHDGDAGIGIDDAAAGEAEEGARKVACPRFLFSVTFSGRLAPLPGLQMAFGRLFRHMC